MAENEERLPHSLLMEMLPELTPAVVRWLLLPLTQLAPHCPFHGLIGAMREAKPLQIRH